MSQDQFTTGRVVPPYRSSNPDDHLLLSVLFFLLFLSSAPDGVAEGAKIVLDLSSQSSDVVLQDVYYNEAVDIINLKGSRSLTIRRCTFSSVAAVLTFKAFDTTFSGTIKLEENEFHNATMLFQPATSGRFDLQATTLVMSKNKFSGRAGVGIRNTLFSGQSSLVIEENVIRQDGETYGLLPSGNIGDYHKCILGAFMFHNVGLANTGGSTTIVANNFSFWNDDTFACKAVAALAFVTTFAIHDTTMRISRNHLSANDGYRTSPIFFHQDVSVKNATVELSWNDLVSKSIHTGHPRLGNLIQIFNTISLENNAVLQVTNNNGYSHAGMDRQLVNIGTLTMDGGCTTVIQKNAFRVDNGRVVSFTGFSLITMKRGSQLVFHDNHGAFGTGLWRRIVNARTVQAYGGSSFSIQNTTMSLSGTAGNARCFQFDFIDLQHSSFTLRGISLPQTSSNYGGIFFDTQEARLRNGSSVLIQDVEVAGDGITSVYQYTRVFEFSHLLELSGGSRVLIANANIPNTKVQANDVISNTQKYRPLWFHVGRGDAVHGRMTLIEDSYVSFVNCTTLVTSGRNATVFHIDAFNADNTSALVMDQSNFTVKGGTGNAKFIELHHHQRGAFIMHQLGIEVTMDGDVASTERYASALDIKALPSSSGADSHSAQAKASSIVAFGCKFNFKLLAGSAHGFLPFVLGRTGAGADVGPFTPTFFVSLRQNTFHFLEGKPSLQGILQLGWTQHDTFPVTATSTDSFFSAANFAFGDNYVECATGYTDCQTVMEWTELQQYTLSAENNFLLRCNTRYYDVTKHLFEAAHTGSAKLSTIACVTCKASIDCNPMRTTSVSGTAPNSCSCQCERDSTINDERCLPLGTTLPQTCSSYHNCSDRATDAVLSTNGTVCQCTCKNGYSGSTCGTCPEAFDADQDCGACAVGFPGEGYPNCAACSVTANCSGRAHSVRGNHITGCKCECFHNTSGATCGTMTESPTLSPTASLTTSMSPSLTISHTSSASKNTPSASLTRSAKTSTSSMSASSTLSKSQSFSPSVTSSVSHQTASESRSTSHTNSQTSSKSRGTWTLTPSRLTPTLSAPPTASASTMSSATLSFERTQTSWLSASISQSGAASTVSAVLSLSISHIPTASITKGATLSVGVSQTTSAELTPSAPLENYFTSCELLEFVSFGEDDLDSFTSSTQQQRHVGKDPAACNVISISHQEFRDAGHYPITLHFNRRLNTLKEMEHREYAQWVGDGHPPDEFRPSVEFDEAAKLKISDNAKVEGFTHRIMPDGPYTVSFTIEDDYHKKLSEGYTIAFQVPSKAFIWPPAAPSFNYTMVVKGEATLEKAEAVATAVNEGSSIMSVTAATLGNPALALQQGRMSSISSLASCAFSMTQELPSTINPTGFGFGSDHGYYFRGAIVGNLIFFVGISVFFSFAAIALFLLRRHSMVKPETGTTNWDVMALCLADIHFPSILIVPLCLGLQGTVAASVAIFLHGDDANDAPIGVLGFCFSLGFVLCVLYVSTRGFKLERVPKPVDPFISRAGEWLAFWFDSPFKWAKPQDEPLWKKKYHLLFCDYCIKYYLTIELAATFIMGISDGIRLSDKRVCFAQSCFILFVFITMMLLFLALAPAFTLFIKLFVVVNCSLGFISAALMAAYFTTNNQDLIVASQYIATTAMIVGMIKFLIDFLFASAWLYARKEEVRAYVLHRTSRKVSVAVDEKEQKWLSSDGDDLHIMANRLLVTGHEAPDNLVSEVGAQHRAEAALALTPHLSISDTIQVPHVTDEVDALFDSSSNGSSSSWATSSDSDDDAFFEELGGGGHSSSRGGGLMEDDDLAANYAISSSDDDEGDDEALLLGIQTRTSMSAAEHHGGGGSGTTRKSFNLFLGGAADYEQQEVGSYLVDASHKKVMEMRRSKREKFSDQRRLGRHEANARRVLEKDHTEGVKQLYRLAKAQMRQIVPNKSKSGKSTAAKRCIGTTRPAKSSEESLGATTHHQYHFDDSFEDILSPCAARNSQSVVVVEVGEDSVDSLLHINEDEL